MSHADVTVIYETIHGSWAYWLATGGRPAGRHYVEVET
jgi:hypothetical protein